MATATASPSTFLAPEEFVEKSLDYIIVGGGTAGLVVAARYVLRH